jgi:hypothetical protein
VPAGRGDPSRRWASRLEARREGGARKKGAELEARAPQAHRSRSSAARREQPVATRHRPEPFGAGRHFSNTGERDSVSGAARRSIHRWRRGSGDALFVGDDGEQLHAAAAARTTEDVEVERSLQELRPRPVGAAARRGVFGSHDQRGRCSRHGCDTRAQGACARQHAGILDRVDVPQRSAASTLAAATARGANHA